MRKSILAIGFGIAVSFANFAFADVPDIGYSDPLSQIVFSIVINDIDKSPAIMPENESFDIDMSPLATVKPGVTWSRINDNKIAGIRVAFVAFEAVYKPYNVPGKIPISA